MGGCLRSRYPIRWNFQQIVVTVLREAWRATNDSPALLCMGTDCEAFFQLFVLIFELEAEPLTLSSCSVLMKQHVLRSFVLMVK